MNNLTVKIIVRERTVVDLLFKVKEFTSSKRDVNSLRVTQMLHSNLTKEKKSHKVLIILTFLESHFDVTIEWE